MLWAARPLAQPDAPAQCAPEQLQRPLADVSGPWLVLCEAMMTVVAVSAASRKHRGALDTPRTGNVCRDGLLRSAQCDRPSVKASSRKCTSRCGSRGLVGAIVARYRPSRRQMAVEKCVTGLVRREQACIRLTPNDLQAPSFGLHGVRRTITTTNNSGPRLAHRKIVFC